MKKKIIIDEEKCIGCGICANTCQQSAIKMVDGKAKVVNENSCDGIGNCLPVCPVNAITFSEENIQDVKFAETEVHKGCPGMKLKSLNNCIENEKIVESSKENFVTSKLNQWPVQIKLVPPTAPYFNNSDILIAADCTAFSYGNFHNDFIKGKITLIGCPKLDDGDYSDKLTEIFKQNEIKSVTAVRMEVPCCSGIAVSTKTAINNSNKNIPLKIVTISLDGKILN